MSKVQLLSPGNQSYVATGDKAKKTKTKQRKNQTENHANWQHFYKYIAFIAAGPDLYSCVLL